MAAERTVWAKGCFNMCLHPRAQPLFGTWNRFCAVPNSDGANVGVMDVFSITGRRTRV